MDFVSPISHRPMYSPGPLNTKGTPAEFWNRIAGSGKVVLGRHKMEKSTGRVKWFDSVKGFGFIKGPEGADVFVHYEDIQMDGFAQLSANEEVEFRAVKTDKGWKAYEVVSLVRPKTTEAESAE